MIDIIISFCFCLVGAFVGLVIFGCLMIASDHMDNRYARTFVVAWCAAFALAALGIVLIIRG